MHRFLTAVLFAGLFSTTSLAQLSGTYTVGSGDDFETITEAVDVLVQDGTDGPVTFELNEQTFDEQVTITPFRRDSSPDDEVLFTFSAGTSPTWRFTGASQTTNWVVRLVNVEHIRFKDIQFDQPSNLDFGTIFKLEGTSDITIENNEFTAPRVVGSAHIDGNGFVNERLTIRNNDFGNGYSAILLENPTVSQFLTIRNNDFEGFANAAVRVARHQDLQLVNNDFTDTSALYPATTVQLTATEGALVQQNTFDIRNQRTAVALSQLTTLPDYTVRFENNYMFYDTPPNGASGAAKVIGGGIGVSIRHNTVLVGRNSLADVYETSTVTPSDRIENNVFVNEGTGSVFNIANALGPAFVSNYNLIHTGAGFPARYNGTSYNTLSEYQAVTGQDASSAFKKPTFQLNTDTDLRLTGSSIGDPTLAAPRISFIPGDHENNFRGATYVYKGADEPEAPLLPLAGFYTIGGTSPDFQTPDQATAALEVLGTSAQVTFNLREETYFDQTTISAFTRTGGSSDEVIFQAQTPLTPPTWNYTIPTAANNWLVRLQGVRHITFRNILFDQSSRSTFGRIFALENGANDITIEGGEVKGILGGSTAGASLITSTGSINALTIQDTDLSLGYTAFDQQSGSTSEIRIENTDLIGQFEAGIVLSGENPTILG
ncbi:MAG: right-handed parallel beta-helix repeat-containing protein, partial [Bacteroidota bacterium]